MKTRNEQITEIQEIIDNNRLLNVRTNKLRELGYTVVEKVMGSGGVGQVKGNWKQISHGWSKHNYALAVRLNK